MCTWKSDKFEVLKSVNKAFAWHTSIFYCLVSVRMPPRFCPRGAKWGASLFELQPLVCSGKVITLTQQCITQVTKLTTNSQQDP